MKVAAIVPAYNEEQTVGDVVNVLKASPLIAEIIVVSDGSCDKTVFIARESGATVVDLKENVGKGGAMKIGTTKTDADIYLFIDADLVGLTEKHISQLVNPVLNQEAEMTVGIFEEGRLATDLAQKIAPSLSGQRAIRREVFEKIPDLEHSRFGVEMSLSHYAEKHNTKVKTVSLPALSQVMKEEKRGFLKGFCMRLKMYWEIFRTTKQL